jgi:hypothetical protein
LRLYNGNDDIDGNNNTYPIPNGHTVTAIDPFANYNNPIINHFPRII